MISSTILRNKSITSFRSENNPDKKSEGHLSMEEEHSTREHIIRANPLQKIELSLRNAFYEIPKSFVHGLQGDTQKTTFHSLLEMAKFPYYVGGAMLYACFRAGGNPDPARKQGIGVLMYYTGMAIGNKFVDEFVKLRYGLDLNLPYVNNNGEIDKVFSSCDFTRWDLLKQKDWDKMANKMGIPDNIADKEAAVREEAAKIIVKARAWKLAIGSILSAFGAGFVAKNDLWSNIHDTDTRTSSLAKLFKKPDFVMKEEMLNRVVPQELINQATSLEDILMLIKNPKLLKDKQNIFKVFGVMDEKKKKELEKLTDLTKSLYKLSKSLPRIRREFNQPFFKRLSEYGVTLKNRAAMTGKILADSFKKLDSAHINISGQKFPFGKVFKYALIATPILAIISLMRNGVSSKNFVSKQEAMPFDVKVASDEILRNKILASINPNKYDYERIYGEHAKQKAASVSIQQDNSRNTQYKESQNRNSQYPNYVLSSTTGTPFGKLDHFFKGDGDLNG